MKNFSEVCRETENKLGRQLQDREMTFLKCMHEHYVKEQNERLSQEEECLG